MNNPLALKLASVRNDIDSKGAPRIFLTFKTESGHLYRTSYGLTEQQLQIANNEIAGAYGFPGSLYALRKLCANAETYKDTIVHGVIEEQEGSLNPKTKEPYKNLRLIPQLKNMDSDILDTLFGEMPSATASSAPEAEEADDETGL